MVNYLKRTWAEIDLGIIEQNYRAIRKKTNPDAKIMGVVKADGYGHGAVYISKKLEACGVDMLAVSNIEEAQQLRLAGISKPILLLGYTQPDQAVTIDKLNLTQTVFNYDYGVSLLKEASKFNLTLKIHFKVDTGMSRLGFFIQNEAAMIDSLNQICSLRNNYAFETDGIFTHFASADEGEAGREYTENQFNSFMKFIDLLKLKGINFKYRHACNSAGLIAYPQMHLDMVRTGIALYGLAPSPLLKGKIDITPAMTMKTVIAHIKRVPPGSALSYGRTYKCERNMTVATVPVGYGDGYPRLLSNKGRMIVCGKLAPIIGRVCMDQLILDISDIPEAKEGMTVTVFGKESGAEFSLDDMGLLMGTINYELACAVNKRVPRVYYDEKEICGCVNYIIPCDKTQYNNS